MGNIDIAKSLVSIIIPVYNTEEYVGYCLNSVVSQTYRRMEIILVNDGSTDGSLAICQNYAKLDHRISIITTENRGVSNARNVGLDAATGEYIQFVDSDDVLRRDMVEGLVQYMEVYPVDLAVCGFEKITLGEDISNIKRDILSTDIMGTECVLTREMFFARMGFILWRTSTLESVANKMFRRTIVMDNQIQFLTKVSLGEDFCFNMDYFRYIRGVVFTNERYYYYLQENGDSLTKKYREDLFDNQMFLIKRFRDCINSFIQISADEEKEIAEYTMAKMMQSLHNLTGEKCRLGVLEKKREIARIINDDYIRHAYKLAEYIVPEDAWIRDCMEFSDIQKIYESLFIENAQVPEGLKQKLINCCDAVLGIHHIRFVEMIRDSLKIRSIKKTVIKCFLKLVGKSKGYDEARQ